MRRSCRMQDSKSGGVYLCKTCQAAVAFPTPRHSHNHNPPGANSGRTKKHDGNMGYRAMHARPRSPPCISNRP